MHLKTDSSTGAFLWTNQNFKNAKRLRIGKFQGKELYWSPMPVSLRGMLCEFIKTCLYEEHLQKNIRTLFPDRYMKF